MAAFFDYPDPRVMQPTLVSMYDEPEEEDSSEEELLCSDYEGDVRMSDLDASPGFLKKLMRRLKSVYDDAVLCDYTLIAQYEKIQVHKVVLAMHSDYFRAMFTSGMKEQLGNKVELKGVTAFGLKSLVDYMYTGKLEVHKFSVEDILGAANHLQVTEVITMCRNFLKQEVQKKPCDSLVMITNLADLYSYWDIYERAFPKLMQNIDDIWKTGDFKSLVPGVLGRILESPDLDKLVEEEYLALLCEWMENDIDERLPHLTQFLGLIRYGLIPTTILQELGERFTFLQASDRFNEINKETEEYQQHDILDRVLLQTQATEVRGRPTVVAFCGQDKIGTYTSENLFVLHCKPKREEWIRACNTPESFCDVGVGELNNFMFVCGGVNAFDGVTKACHVFDPRGYQWQSIAKMNEPRCLFPVVGYGKHVFVFGGQGKDGCLSTVERFCPKSNKWEVISKMPQKFRKHAACKLNNYIYICGGERPKQATYSFSRHKDSCVVTNSIWQFDPANGGIQELPPMPRPMAGHSFYPNTDTNHLLVISSDLDKIVDRYDPTTRQWTMLNLNEFSKDIVQGFTPINNAKGVFVGGAIYFINNLSHNCVRFDLASSKCRMADNYPDDVGGLYVQTCILTVPIPRLLCALKN